MDSLYASIKAMVCIVGNSVVALQEMERTGGFQVRERERERVSESVCVSMCSVRELV